MVIRISVDDQREHIVFYGFYTSDWFSNFGTFSNVHYLLHREYISEGCSTLDSSEASVTHNFLYPDHIKKTYFIEGTITGNIVLAASGCTSTVTDFRVTVCKVHEDNTETELATAGWITVNDTIAWDAGLSIGDEMVYWFSIDVWEEQKITDNERLYLKIEVNCNSCTHLMFTNDPKWEDVWVDIPFRL